MNDKEETDFEKRLAAIDFSAESRVRHSLRARLLREAGGAPRPRAWHLWAPALAAACAILLLMSPALRTPTPPVERPPAFTPQRAPRMPQPPAPAPQTLPEAAAQDPDSGPDLETLLQPGRAFQLQDLFRPVDGGAPIVDLPMGPPAVTAKGRHAASEGRRAVTWELEGSTFVLEQRRTSLDEIFHTGML